MGLIIVYFILMWNEYPLTLGGSIVFITLIALNCFFSTLRIVNPWFLTTFSMMLLLFMSINHVAYLESLHGVQSSYIPWYICLGYIMFHVYSISVCLSIGSGSERRSESEIGLRKSITIRILMKVFFPYLIGALVTGAVFLVYAHREAFTVKLSLMKHYLFWFIVGQAWVLIANRKEIDWAFSKLTIEKSALRIRNPRKIFIVFALATLFIGSAFEMMRGLWFVWFGTWLAVTLMVMNYWRMWKYSLSENNKYTYESIDNNRLDTMGNEFELVKYLIRFVVIGALLGTAYMLILAVLLVKHMY